MKLAAWLFLLFVVADAPTRPEPAIPYFSNVRDVQIAQPDGQNFFVVDQEIWKHSRPDLGDLRLYDREPPVQFAISEQRAGIFSDEVEAKVLNLGRVSGHTEFDLDAESLAEYDRIRLRLDAHDFIATASVWGARPEAAAADVLLTWKQLVALHRQWHFLTRELKDAELALGQDNSEANYTRLLDVKARLQSLDGTEALIEGFGASSGRGVRSL